MGGDSRREYLRAIRQRYSEASKEEKGLILQEFCEVCKYHRKHAIRLLNQRKRGPTKRPGRKPIYRSPEFLGALKRIWLATDQMCSKKLVVAIPIWLPFYEGTYDKLSAKTTDQLLSISAATIDRLLAKTRAKTRLRGLGGTKPGSLLRNQIPIKTHNWDISQPGFTATGTLSLVPIDPITGQPNREPLIGEISEIHESVLSDKIDRAYSNRHQLLLPSSVEGAGQYFERIRASSPGQNGFQFLVRCADDPESLAKRLGGTDNGDPEVTAASPRF